MFVIALAACGGPLEPPPPHRCHSDEARIDVAPPRESFGTLAPDDPLWYGTPPQGGAPYSPLRVRVRGDEAFAEGIDLTIEAYDRDTDERLAELVLETQMICANVGENTGFWVGSEIHLRYVGFDLEELEGRPVELTVRAAAHDSAVAISSAWRVALASSE